VSPHLILEKPRGKNLLKEKIPPFGAKTFLTKLLSHIHTDTNNKQLLFV